MNPKVDLYLADGCGRCDHFATPNCKVRKWQEELKALRKIVLDCGLTEELKWSCPCYTWQGKNIVMVSALKGHCILSFFKGALLRDEKGFLQKPGPNSHVARIIQVTSVKEIAEREADIKAYIHEAVKVEKASLKVETKKNPEPIPKELQQKFDELPELEKAFFSLTPGRQRGYIIHFSQPKQSKTRTSRIENCIPKILDGEGLHDSYKN